MPAGAIPANLQRGHEPFLANHRAPAAASGLGVTTLPVSSWGPDAYTCIHLSSSLSLLSAGAYIPSLIRGRAEGHKSKALQNPHKTSEGGQIDPHQKGRSTPSVVLWRHGGIPQ